MCYLRMINNNITRGFLISSIMFLIGTGLQSCTKPEAAQSPNRVKLAMRAIGDQLLLNNQDSISLVKPVLALQHNMYQLSFTAPLTIYPDSLVTLVKYNLNKSQLSPYYLVEVLQCQDQEVAYSYQMHQEVEQSIIPCSGRLLPNGCYVITIQFTKWEPSNSGDYWYIYLIIGCVLAFIVLYFKYNSKKVVDTNAENTLNLGHFKFYPDQHKLVTSATEISLSNKECELLILFMQAPNQVIKREALIKQVWEDNGVIVGRSLDTYISKLRKKLKEDTSIKLTNVHGVGYKLEVKV